MVSFGESCDCGWTITRRIAVAIRQQHAVGVAFAAVLACCLAGLVNQYTRASQDFAQAIERNPNDAEAFFKRGVAYGRKGQYDNALDDFDQVIRLKPNLAEA